MKVLHLVHVALILSSVGLAKGAGGPLPPSVIPESVKNGAAGLQFLWEQVEEGMLHKKLPSGNEVTGRAWKYFLHNEAEPLILDYYR